MAFCAPPAILVWSVARSVRLKGTQTLMEFFDCNAAYGSLASSEDLMPVPTIDALQARMRRAGVAKAVVSRLEQSFGGSLTSNRLLADDIASTEDLFGTCAILPTHTHEMPTPEALLPLMKERRIVGWRLYPSKDRFLPHPFVLRDWFAAAVGHHVPVFVNTAHGTTLADLAAIMQEFPELTVVLTLDTDWPSDRFLRPFVAEYPNVYLDTSSMITDGGIESFVADYGPLRLLYGSGFPKSYFGANMLMIRHAAVPDADKAAIASGNMQRIIRETLL